MAIVNEDQKIMSSINTDLIWSQYPDRFLTFGNELKLWVVDSKTQSPQMFGGIQLSELTYSQILFSKCEIRFVKSMACNNKLLKYGTNVLYALGYQNGKIVLNAFDTNQNPSQKEKDPNMELGLIGKEFNPEYPRSCNTLDFCQLDNNLLASGFDRNKSECSVMVWDIAHTGISYNQAAQSATISGTTKPLHQFAPNEQVHSLRWFRDRILVCGMSQKQLRLVDIRDNSIHHPTSSTKGVYGITPDTHTEYRFASYFENYIYVWDLRSFDTPLITLGPEPSSFVKLEWCPTRPNILASLLKDTNSIRLYDYKNYINLNDMPEPSIVRRDITPFEVHNPQIISSFSWNPTSECQMTVITSNGMIRDFKVVDRITLNWSPISEIIWTHGKKILQCIDSSDNIYKEIDDIAVRMRRLAMDGYGLTVDNLWQMFCKENSLYFHWKWVHLRIKNDYQSPNSIKTNENIDFDVFAANNPERYSGINGILFGDDSPELDSLLHPSDTATNVPDFLAKRRVYTSLSRAKALQFCGWSSQYFNLSSSYGLDEVPIIASTFDEQMPCDYFITSNEDEHNFTRIAAVMVFNGRIGQAIECLNRASDTMTKAQQQQQQQHSGNRLNDSQTNGKQQQQQYDKAVSLNAIALALSTFIASSEPIDSNNANIFIWNDICSKMKPKLEDPYIKAIFNFIFSDLMTTIATETSIKYSDIINDDKLDIGDRVAFACMYLPDAELTSFIQKVQTNLIEKFDLRAILFTGLTEDGIELFANYVENTSDVQTIALTMLWTLPNPLIEIPLVKIWIDTYKQLLDCWRLWNVRARYELKWHECLNPMEEVRQKIYIVCNYCRAPVSQYIHADSNNNRSPGSQPLPPPPLPHQTYSRASTANISSSKFRVCSCTNCGKTLPRCSLCLTQLGTPAGIYWRPGIVDKSERKLSPFSSWFTWCQTCRHGGHSGHLIEWFTENPICPVAGCKCKCMGLDANAKPKF